MKWQVARSNVTADLPRLAQSLTVAICTRNRKYFVSRCLSSLLACEGCSDVPIVLIDNGSDDGTWEFVAERFPSVNRISEPLVGLSHARNRAVEICETPYIVFLDDDAEPDPTWLLGCVECVKAGADVFGGPFRPFYLGTKKPWFHDDHGSAHLELVDGVQLYPVCFSGGIWVGG